MEETIPVSPKIFEVTNQELFDKFKGLELVSLARIHGYHYIGETPDGQIISINISLTILKGAIINISIEDNYFKAHRSTKPVVTSKTIDIEKIIEFFEWKLPENHFI